MLAGFNTHTGRRLHNQDNALVDPVLGLYAVADGVGGGDSGEIASASVCWSLRRGVVGGAGIEEAIHQAHKTIMANPVAGKAGYAASTVVVAQQHQHQIKLAWVGDSRAYLLRNGKLYQLSEDHSVVQQVAGLSPADILKMRHVLTQAVGVAGEEGLLVDGFDVERHPGDCWLLCSDGLHGVVTDEQIEQVLGKAETAEQKAAKLLGLALANGADDNVTLIVLNEDAGYEPSLEVTATSSLFLENLDEDSIDGEDADKIPILRPAKPWYYFVLGGVLMVILFGLLIWGA